MARGSATERPRSKDLVTVIVYIHQEGRLLHHCLKSLNRAIRYAKEHGVEIELLLVADSIDDDTRAYLQQSAKQTSEYDYELHKTQYGDSGLARNYGVSKANGKYVFLVNAKDVVSEHLIVASLEALQAAERPAIVHPEYRLLFDGKNQLWRTVSSTDKHFSPWLMVENNCFPSLVMAPKKLLVEHPYRAELQGQRYGDQDWLWNCDTLAAGIDHIVAPEGLLADRAEISYQRQPTTNGMRQTQLLSSKTVLPPEDTAYGYVTEELPSGKNKTLKRLRSTVDAGHRTRVNRYVRNRSPRAEAYLTSLRNETLHLLRPVTVEHAPVVPDWLRDEVRELNSVDLSIMYIEHLLNQRSLEFTQAQAGVFSEAYWELERRLSADMDLLFLVPYIKNGGAEREIVTMIDTLLAMHPKRVIRMIATEPSDSPWASHIDKRVDFIEPGPAFRQLSVDEQGKLLAMLCVQLRPKRVHIINSQPGYSALQYYAPAIAEHTKIFLTIFSIDRSAEGMPTHTFAYRMQQAIDQVTTVFTDNQTVVDQLTESMGIDPAKFSVHYQPAATAAVPASQDALTKRFTNSPLNILWAGRIDQQKRPDVLVRIAEAAAKQHLAAQFHVYGSSAFEGSDYMRQINESPHIVYHGPYDNGLQSLPLEEFDAFLMTSEFEGMPNVLLEAIVGGLLVIAPDAGGVKELIRDNDTGYFIDEFDDVESYLDRIQKIITDGDHARELVRNAQKLVLERHSRAAYEKQFKSEKQYTE